MDRDELIDAEWDCLKEMRRLLRLAHSLQEESAERSEVWDQWKAKRTEKHKYSALLVA